MHFTFSSLTARALAKTPLKIHGRSRITVEEALLGQALLGKRCT